MTTAFQQPAAAQSRPPATGIAGQVTTHVLATIKHAAAHAPRSLQAAAGLSELGTPCMRRLAYKTAGWDKPNDDRDNWLSTIGTSVHAWMAGTFEAENRRLGRQRYLVEHRVHLPGGISGSSDLLDRDMHVNNDWKVCGLSSIRTYRRSGPGAQYRAQAHLYGLGMLLAGEQVTDVAITFLPRGGLLASEIHVWSEPLDTQLAIDTLRRYEATRAALITLDPEATPAMWAMFPTADAHCEWCPYHLPMSRDLSKGCPGHKTALPRG